MSNWRVKLICCGREDGYRYEETWEAADAFRMSYISGPAVHPHGYSAHPAEPGHKRAAIIELATPEGPASKQEDPQHG